MPQSAKHYEYFCSQSVTKYSRKALNTVYTESLKLESSKALIRTFIPRSKPECPNAQTLMNILRSQTVRVQH